MKPLPAILLGALALGCRQDMHDQPKRKPMAASRFFPDGRATRPQVPGTVARGQLELDEQLFRGTVAGEPATTFPFEVTREVLERGRARYDIFCAICHDAGGFGRGMAVVRGLKQPSSFHVERLRAAPPGYFFDVITKGFGAMVDYSDRIPPRDRWAIVAYVRALQLSQNAKLADAPEPQRQLLEGAR